MWRVRVVVYIYRLSQKSAAERCVMYVAKRQDFVFQEIHNGEADAPERAVLEPFEMAVK